jgi:hypothetical protein
MDLTHPRRTMSLRTEKIQRNSVYTFLESGTKNLPYSIFKSMSRPERIRMYTQCSSTGDKDLFASKDTIDIDLSASKFASWLVIKINSCHTLGIISSNACAENKDKFIKWLEEPRDNSSSCQSPDEQKTVQVKIQKVDKTDLALIYSVVQTTAVINNRRAQQRLSLF